MSATEGQAIQGISASPTGRECLTAADEQRETASSLVPHSPLATRCRSHDVVQHPSFFDAGEPHIQAQVLDGELLVANPQQAKQGRVQITHMDDAFDGAMPKFVGRPRHLAAADSPAAHLSQHGTARWRPTLPDS